MKNTNWYVIKDLDEFVNNTRVLVYNSFGSQQANNPEKVSLTINPEEQEEFDKVLNYNECEIIIKQIVRSQTNKNTHEKRYLINDVLLEKIIEQLNTRLVSNILSTLVNKGLIETTYDSELNDFCFWVSDKNNT